MKKIEKIEKIEKQIALVKAQEKYKKIKSWLKHDRKNCIKGNITALEYRIKKSKLEVMKAELEVLN